MENKCKSNNYIQNLNAKKEQIGVGSLRRYTKRGHQYHALVSLRGVQSSPGAACPLGYNNYALQTPEFGLDYSILES